VPLSALETSDVSWSSAGVLSAWRRRYASQRFLMIGLMKSAASRSHFSLSQFFQPPFFQRDLARNPGPSGPGGIAS